MNANDQQHGLDDQQLETLLAECSRETPQPDASFAARLRRELLEQALPVGATSRADSRSARAQSPLARWLTRSVLAATAAAALVVLLWARSPSVWAQVRDVLQEKPWIRLRATLDDGKHYDNWISIPLRKSAFRVGPTARYVDLKDDVQYDYEESRGTVVRAPHRPIQSPDSLLSLFDQLLRGKDPNITELDHATVVEQRSRTVVENGKEWRHVELMLRRDAEDHSFAIWSRVEFVIDPATHLPHTMKLTLIDPGPNYPADAKRQFEFAIDYPAEGPADIYALGIPKTAKLDDRMPPVESARLLQEMTRGRRDFDPYMSIVFHAATNSPLSGIPASVVWRKGNQVRVELCRPKVAMKPYTDKPAAMNDVQWWQERLRSEFRFLPVLVCDGRTSYVAEFGPPDAQGNQPISKWRSLTTIHSGETVSELHLSPVRGSFPEFFAYPLVEVSDTTNVELESQQEPPSLLLTYNVTRPEPGAYLRSRYWLDQLHGHVATRMSLDRLNVPLDQAIQQKLCLEDVYVMSHLKQTPKGFWYPTLVSRSVAQAQDDKQEAKLVPQTTTAFLLDFSAEFPSHAFTRSEKSAFK